MGSASSRPTPVPITTVDSEKRQAVASLTSSLSSLSLAPKSANGALSIGNLSAWEEQLAADPKAELARIILCHSDISSALVSRSARTADTHIFNTAIDFKTGPITNQKSSGRCWLFATTNVIRYEVMKKLKLKDFQLSQVRTSIFLWKFILFAFDSRICSSMTN